MKQNSKNGWPSRRLKYLATINNETLPETTEPDYEMNYIDIGNVNSNGQIDAPTFYRFENAPSRARRVVRDGDVIISTVRTYLQAIAPIESPTDNLIVSTGFAVVRPVPKYLTPKFCKYLLREPSFLSEVEQQSVGVSYPAINASDLGNIIVSAPSIDTQHRIADYLDRETARIDALITAKERLLILLAEKRQALITRAVTCGLDPNVKMKDSGVEWLGEVPEHWRIEKAKWLFWERNERSLTGEEEMLTVSHITGITARSEKNVNMFEAESTEGYKIVYKNDLVINTLWAWMGAMGVSPLNGIVSPAYHVYKISEYLDPAYANAISRTPIFATEVTRYSKGVWSSRLRLYPEGLYEVLFPVPPIEEQRQITNYIKKENSKIESLRSLTESSVILLKERRYALISASVSGQLEIKNHES